MSLTMGTAPFGHAPGGRFNFAMPEGTVLWFEDSPRRVRGLLDGETVVDSRAVKLLHESRRLPVWYFPRADVRMDRLRDTGERTPDPHKGEARHWALRPGRGGAWEHADPPLAGHVAFAWDSMDAWLEEDEEVFVHPRDPYHRVDVLETSRHVVVRLDDEVLADTRRARVLFEAGLPPRWYVPEEDLRAERLAPCDLMTVCPYKGTARYRSARVGETVEEAVAWCYPQPRPEVAGIAGHWCFYQERVAVEVDGR